MKNLLIYNATSPYPEHIKVGFKSQLQQLLITFSCNYSRKYLRIDPVASFAKYLPSVYFKLYGRNTPGFGESLWFIPGSPEYLAVLKKESESTTVP